LKFLPYGPQDKKSASVVQEGESEKINLNCKFYKRRGSCSELAGRTAESAERRVDRMSRLFSDFPKTRSFFRAPTRAGRIQKVSRIATGRLLSIRFNSGWDVMHRIRLHEGSQTQQDAASRGSLSSQLAAVRVRGGQARWILALFVGGLLSVNATRLQAATITGDLIAEVDEVPTVIGDFSATQNPRNPQRRANDDNIDAIAHVNAPYACCNSYHWLQVISAANKGTFTALMYDGKPVDGNSGDAGKAVPIIDVPNPNYDGRAPDDDLPWYLTRREENGSNPNLGGNTIYADCSGRYEMKDQPNYGGFTFYTYFVGENEEAPMSFNVLAGFTWTYGSFGGDANLAALPISTLQPVGAADITRITNALAIGGFAGWSVENDYYDVQYCPEPASIVMFGCLFGFVGYAARRKTSIAA
jgi:hypothetical protein